MNFLSYRDICYFYCAVTCLVDEVIFVFQMEPFNGIESALWLFEFCFVPTPLICYRQSKSLGLQLRSKCFFYFLLQHPSIQCGWLICLGSLIPLLFNSYHFSFNKYKSVPCKCYKTLNMPLIESTKILFSSTSLVSGNP